MDPGPEDPSVLYEQMIHRSTQIWDYGQEFTLQTRNGNRTVIEGYRVQQYLKMTGFYGLYHLGFVRTDRPLVSALVERWRPETHTFHMPTTECTITLQDVEVLLGVPIDGKAIISNYHTTDKSVWRAHCIRLLGLDPGDNVKGAKLKMGWLRSHVQSHPLHPNVSEEDVRCRTRAVILLLLGGQYLSDKSGSYVWLRYLLFLEDLEHCKDYSWGSAILATLYRNMCYSAYGGSDIAGPLILLQIWAWIRFPPIRPVQINELIHFPEEDDPLLPVYTYAYRWAKAARVYNPDTVGHGLRHFRDLFDRLKDDQIIWEPYENLDLPDYCCAGKNIWRARVPLICFELVEYYHPERVNRQFGMRQGIPIAAFKDTTLHNHTGRGHKDEKWEDFHKKFVEEWDDRHQRVVNGDYHNGFQPVDVLYKQWYKSITRRFMLPANYVPATGFRPTAATIGLMHSKLVESYHEFYSTNNQRMISSLEKCFIQLHLDIPTPLQRPSPQDDHLENQDQSQRDDYYRPDTGWVNDMLTENTPMNMDYELGFDSGFRQMRD